MFDYTLNIIEPRQSLIDIAIQSTGSIEAAFEIAALNDIAITDNLTPGASIVVPQAYKKAIQQYFATKKLKPATALSLTDENILNNLNEDTMKVTFFQKNSRTAMELTPSNEYEAQLLTEFFDEHLESKFKSRFRFEYDEQNNKAVFYFQSYLSNYNLSKAGYFRVEALGNAYVKFLQELPGLGVVVYNGGVYNTIYKIAYINQDLEVEEIFEEGVVTNIYELGLIERGAHKYA